MCNVSRLVAIGVHDEGYREVLDIREGAKEDKAGWSAFLKHLKEGLKGVRLIIFDARIGLAESAAEFFPDAALAKVCRRTLVSQHPQSRAFDQGAGDRGDAQCDPWIIAAAGEKAVRVIEKPRGLRLTRAAEPSPMRYGRTGEGLRAGLKKQAGATRRPTLDCR